MPTIPTVRIVGKKGSGKTDLIEAVTAELVRRGYIVSAIKHSAHKSSFDQQGKDTWRFSRAGARVVGLCSSHEFVTITKLDHELDVSELELRLDPSIDIILIEGFRKAKGPKIEILSNGDQPSTDPDLIAIVSDHKQLSRVPSFRREQIKEICDLIESGFLKPPKRRVMLVVDGREIKLNEFVSKIIRSTLMGMISSLKGVNSPRKISIHIIESDDDSTLIL